MKETETPIITVAQMNALYRRFRAELRRQTNVDSSAVHRWMAGRADRLAAGYHATGENGSMYDYMAYIHHQYVRAIGLAR